MKQHVNTGDVGRGINMLSFSQYNTTGAQLYITRTTKQHNTIRQYNTTDAHCSDNSILHVPSLLVY